MQIHLNHHDGVPIYRQIVNQVKYLIASGRLAEGEELPAIRVLAAQLVINPNTVARAYQELERDGTVAKRHGSGTYVSDAGSPLKEAARREILTQRIDALLTEAQHLGVGVEDLLELLRKRQAKLKPKNS